MKLNEIASELFSIATGIEYNTISYFHPMLVSAKGKAKPDDLILAIAVALKRAATNGTSVTKAELSENLKALKAIGKEYKIDELKKPIKELQAYHDSLI